MIETMNDISDQVGYDIMHYNNDEIKPVSSLHNHHFIKHQKTLY